MEELVEELRLMRSSLNGISFSLSTLLVILALKDMSAAGVLRDILEVLRGMRNKMKN